MDIEKVRNFLDNPGKIAIVFHDDGDGICSAAIVAKALAKLKIGCKWYCVQRNEPYVGHDIIKKLLDFDSIIGVDIPVLKNLERLPKKKILWIDHHPVPEKIPGNLIYINPRVEDPQLYIPASKVCFDVLSQIVDISNYEWIAAAGFCSDYGFKYNPEYADKIREKYPGLVGKEKTQEELMNNAKLGILTKLVNPGTLEKNKEAEFTVKVLVNSETSEDILEKRTPGAEKIWENYLDLEKEIQRILLDVEKNAKIFEEEKLILYTLETDYKIRGVIAEKIMELYPSSVVIICVKTPGKVRISLRTNRKNLNLVEIGKSALNGLKHTHFGGHPPACAGAINTEDFGKFLKKFREKLKEHE